LLAATPILALAKMAIFGRKTSSSGSSGEIRDLEGKQQYGNGKEPIATFTEEGNLQPSDDPRNRLHRGLQARQIGMIAIGMST
jgi:amino acid permease